MSGRKFQFGRENSDCSFEQSEYAFTFSRASELQKFLVTGASGFLGWNFAHLKSPELQSVGFCHTRKAPWFHECFTVDLSRESDVSEWVRKLQPDVIFHFAAMADPNQCQENVEDSKKINVSASIALAKLASDVGAAMVFASTDLVFDGKRGGYSEQDTPNPVSIYGEHKIMAEKGVQEHCERSYICRLPMLYGECHPSSRTNLLALLKSLKAGRPLRLFHDEIRSMARAKSVITGMLACLKAEPGIYHLGGEEALSRFEFGRHVCKVYGMNEQLLESISQDEIIMSAPRPRDVSMKSDKAKGIGFCPKPVDLELSEIKTVLSGTVVND